MVAVVFPKNTWVETGGKSPRNMPCSEVDYFLKGNYMI
jgi:hypothetical protein